MGRGKHYNDAKLLDIVEREMLLNDAGWMKVTQDYRDAAEEATLRNWKNVRHHCLYDANPKDPDLAARYAVIRKRIGVTSYPVTPVPLDYQHAVSIHPMLGTNVIEIVPLGAPNDNHSVDDGGVYAASSFAETNESIFDQTGYGEPAIPIPPTNHSPALVERQTSSGSDVHSDSGEFVPDESIQANHDATGERTIELATTDHFMKTNEGVPLDAPNDNHIGDLPTSILEPVSGNHSVFRSAILPDDSVDDGVASAVSSLADVVGTDEETNESIYDQTGDWEPVIPIPSINHPPALVDRQTRSGSDVHSDSVEFVSDEAIENNNDRVADASFHADGKRTEEKPVESNTNDDIVGSTDSSYHGPSITTDPCRTIDLPTPIDSYLRAIITEHESQTNRLGQLRALVKVYCRRFPGDKSNCKTQVDSSIANHKYNTEMFKELLEIVECHQLDNKVEMAKIIRVGFLKNLRLHEENHTILLMGLVQAMEYHRDTSNSIKRLPAQVLRQFMEFRKERELISNLLYSKLEEVELWHHWARKANRIKVRKEPSEFYVNALYLIVSVLALIYDYHETTAHLV